MTYKTLKDLPDVAGKKVLVRFDFNVPIEAGKVVDDYRIKKSLPTLKYLQDKKAKIIIISHIEGESDTLKPVFEYLKNTLSLPVSFCEDCLEKPEQIAAVADGEIVLCENLRLYDGEKKNDEEFAKKLAALGEFFVNDAFSVSHRKHASVVGIPKFLPSFAGIQLEAEIENLSKAFNPPQPFLFILGGAKFDTKLPLVQKFLPIATNIFITGALANDFYKAEGINVGMSMVSSAEIDLTELATNPKIVIQPDAIAHSSSGKREIVPQDVRPDESMLDAGSLSIEAIGKLVRNAKTVLWNGTFGNYENGYVEATHEAAKIIAAHDCLSIVGGGDTVASISSLNLEDKFSFVSTGGGAMLDFLAQGTLPGIEALKRKK